MPIALRDSDAVRKSQSIIKDLNDYTQASATNQGLLTEDDNWFFDQQQPVDPAPDFMQIAKTMAQHKNEPDSCLRVARYMGASRIVLNALGYFYRASVTPPPRERFETFIREGLKDAKTHDSFLDTLEAARDEMVISIVQTMHPTIYHTKFAREQETALTATLEKISDAIAEGNNIESLMEQARSHIDTLTAGMAAGTQITPDKPVTVAEENTLDRENHEKMRITFKNVIQDFNAAIQAVTQAPAGRLDADQAERLRNVMIRPEQVEYRTWAYAADADGRDKATSIELYSGIYRQVTEDDTEYKSRKRDPRENAKDHMNAVSCLLQAAASTQQYGNVLHDYLQESGLAGETILQDLSKSRQEALLRELVSSDNHFSNAFRDDMDKIKARTVAFNRMFSKVYPDFLKEKGLIRKSESDTTKPETVELESLPQALRQELSQRISDISVTVGDEQVRFTLDPDALTYERIKESESDQRFLFEGLTIKNKNETRPLTVPERRKLLDVIKRLQVLDHAIDQFGNEVADRYQIANFSDAADFYSALLLFKETGIITVEQGKVASKTDAAGKVISPKLSMQPLLETAEDQRNAPQLFEKLLKDPLVRSYYASLGNKADIMFGYSDGAKSAGNFASEWSIRQNARKLYDKFAEHGIELQVFHGRGRGDSRGGQFDPGQNQRMMDPALAKNMRLDETQQSDLPLAGATSEKFGEDMCASTLTGIVTAGWEARKAGDYPSYRKDDPIIQELADESERVYKELVYEPEATRKLLGAIHDNPYKSSRAAARGAAPDSLDKIRAITVEYGFNMVDAPLHYVGTKAALEKYIASHPDGIEALQKLYQTHPFFQGMMDKTAQGLIDYNPQVFRAYAKAVGVTDWAKDCIKELDGMRDLVQQIREQTQVQKLTGPRRNPRQVHSGTGPSQAVLLEQNPLHQEEKELNEKAHALAVAQTIEGETIQPITPEHNPLRPTGETEAQIMRDISFINAAHAQSRMLHPPANTRENVDGLHMAR